MTRNGSAMPVGAYILLQPKDVIKAPGSATYQLWKRCTPGGPEEPLAKASNGQPITFTSGDAGPFMNFTCSPAPQALLQIDPNALHLGLESGSLQVEALATVGAIELSTPHASTLALRGTTFAAAYDPGVGASQFDCLAGSLLVQPTAAGAPPLTLGPPRFVRVTAAGAEPVGHLRSVNLPVIMRVFPPVSGPKAGYWLSPAGGSWFTVQADQANVINYGVRLDVAGCGRYDITKTVAVPIANGSFSFTGAFYASGAFAGSTSEAGQLGLNNLNIAGCGTVSTNGPIAASHTWNSALDAANRGRGGRRRERERSYSRRERTGRRNGNEAPVGPVVPASMPAG